MSDTPLHGISAQTLMRDSSFVMKEHHCHSFFELIYIENGSCRFLINDAIHDMHAGDFILIPPYVLHYTSFPFGTCRLTILFFSREDMGDRIVSYLPGSADFLTESRIFQVPDAHRDHIALAISQMVQELRIHDDRTSEMMRLLLQATLLQCSRICNFLMDTPEQIHTTDRQIIQAAQFICDHYMNPITSADIARAAGFSPNYLSRKFRDAAGIGLHEYLVFIRLHHAALELVSTKDSITQIALRCGFSDSNYFKDAFKKKYNMTPREYRKLG